MEGEREQRKEMKGKERGEERGERESKAEEENTCTCRLLSSLHTHAIL